MEFQQAQVRAPRMSRINWTQTTTVTLAAFIGCLAAMVVLVVLFKSSLAKGIKQRMARVDQLDKMIDETEDELALKLDRNKMAKESLKPVEKAVITKPVSEDADQSEKENVQEEPKGELIETTPTV